MAETTVTRRADAWKEAYSIYLNLNQQLERVQPRERDALERAVAAQEEELLELPAPSLTALVRKLELLWDCQLEGLDSETEAKRLILEDLGDLIAEQAQLLGVQPSA